MRFKTGVKIGKMTPQLAFIIGELNNLWMINRLNQPVCTSFDDGDHGVRGVPDSVDTRTLHGKGRAIDIRTRDISRNNLKRLVKQCKEQYGPLGFDVVLEDENGPNEHLHIEFDHRGD